MRFKCIALFGLALCGVGGAAQLCRADTAAVSFSLPANVTTSSGFDTLGYEFQVNDAITVTRLGLYDNGQGVGSSNSVGLWSSNGTLLASTSVPSAGIQDGYFLYTDITPVNLTAGQDYYVAAISNGGQYAQTTTDFTTAPQISFLNAAYAETGSLAFPKQTDFANGYFGGNFEFTEGDPPAAPLPSTVEAGLGLLGAFGCWMLMRRRARSAQ